MATKNPHRLDTGYTLSFLLGNNEEEARESLLSIKDAMAAAVMIKQEDELSMDDQTATYCRLFYQAADLQYRQLLATIPLY